MKRPSALDECQFCVLATFHSDDGAVVERSVPAPTGLAEQELAEQMIPDGMHDQDEDWTVLIRPVAHLALPHIPRRPDHVQSKLPHAHGHEAGDCIYILSLARTIRREEEPRGAYLVALALGTMHPHLSIFQPVLVLALDAYIATRDASVVDQLYEAVNTLHWQSLPCLSYSEKMRMRGDSVLHALDHPSPRLMHAHASLSVDHAASGTRQTRRHSSLGLPRRSRARYAISPPQHAGPQPHFFATCMQFGTTCMPVHIPLHVFPEEIGEYSLSNLFATFGHAKLMSRTQHPHLHSNGIHTHPMTLLFNALITHKRVLFVAYHAPAKVVVDHVLAACALASGCGAVLRGFVASAMPYATLVNIDALSHQRGFIVGTKHPRLAELGLWDVLCHCEAQSITVSPHLSPPRPLPPFLDTRHPARPSLRHTLRSMPECMLGDERPHAPDVLFMQRLTSALQQHASESFLRYWCQRHVRDFVALATRHEQTFYGSSLFQPTIHLSHDARDTYMLRCHALRIEGWRGTPSYRSFLWDMSHLYGQASRTAASFCLAHSGRGRALSVDSPAPPTHR